MAIIPAAVLASFGAIYNYGLIPTLVGALSIAALSGVVNYWLAVRRINRLR